MLSNVLHSGLSGLKVGSLGDEAGTKLLDDDDSTENQLQTALEQTLLKNIQYKVSQKNLHLWLRFVCLAVLSSHPVVDGVFCIITWLHG